MSDCFRIFFNMEVYIHTYILEALAWRLSQPGFDPSYGKLLSSYTDEF